MSFKEELKTKIPGNIQQTPEFSIILKLIDNEDIKSAKGLETYCNNEIEKCSAELKVLGAAGSTSNRKRVKVAEHIGFCKLITERILKYL